MLYKIDWHNPGNARGDVKKALWLQKWYRLRWCIIRGRRLDEVITRLYRSRPWWQLPVRSRVELLDYSLQLLDGIQWMHGHDYIHRDINPGNFLVARRRLVMIDLELAFSIRLKQPYPPFGIGTPEDIYAIGATLLTILTGLTPGKFSTRFQHILHTQLRFFIADPFLVSTICSCFLESPRRRPGIPMLKKAIREFREKQSAATPLPTPPFNPIDNRLLETAIRNALQSLNTPVVQHPDGHPVYPGFAGGVSGILFLLAKARLAGFDIDPPPLPLPASGIPNPFPTTGIPHVPTGWFDGCSGIAMAMMEALKNNLLTTRAQTLADIRSCLQYAGTDGWGIADGVAGRGMVLLSAASLFGEQWVWMRLHRDVESLLSAQKRDGSWLLPKNKQTVRKIPGFAYGAAGIACFLLSYAQHFNDDYVRSAAARTLHWLARRRDDSDRSLNTGMSGILLAFIKGYEVLKDPHYQRLTDASLEAFPAHIVDRDLTLATGLAGIGETCLEAGRIFPSGDYVERASWIVRLLLHSFQQQDDGSLCWIADDNAYAKSGLLTGNCGILHFLLRYYRPGLFHHPLLPV